MNRTLPADFSISPNVHPPVVPTKRGFWGWVRHWQRTLFIVWVLGRFAWMLYRDLRRTRTHSAVGNLAALPAEKLEAQAARLREQLIRLGPTFIKIGQALATRADLLPVPFIQELAKLQNRVPPFPNREAFAIIERELGRPVHQLFRSVDPHPIAAASLGQVYRGVRHDGQEVAIKVQRPNLVARISEDVDILRRLARWMASSKRLFKGNDWVGMIDEFERTIYAELDYRNEGRNAERFRRNFADWPRVHVPTIFWEQTTSRVITMEFLRGICVTDLEGLAAAGIDAKEANELMYRTYFKQLLEDGFFHADPHPGNILILRDGRLAFFDFGMVGHISPTLQSQMVSAFFHLIERDAPGIVQDLVGLGFLAPEADMEDFARVVEDLFRRKLDVNLSEVRFKDLTYDLGDIIYRYPFSTPASFTFIIRALMTLEGISITMNPRFNFLEVAMPYARDFLFRRESAQLREKVWASLHDARNGKLNWTRVWNLARTALALYFA